MKVIPVMLLCFGGVTWAADFEIVNEPEFARIISADAKIQTLGTGLRFTEGPTWIKDGGGYLVFSDIPADELKKWTAQDGVTTFRAPSQNANGNTTDLEGRLVSAEHGSRRVSRTEKDGTVVTVVDQHDGKKLNSPNDVVVCSDGTIWFTDPDYGLSGRPKEQEGNYVYRFDPKSKALTAVVKDFDKPNGLCFSPDETLLYIADSGRPRHIRVFDVRGGALENGRVFCTLDKGGPDGIRCDSDGRVWSSSGSGVHVFARDGSLICRINTPKPGANLCFGGKDGTTVFITARDGLHALETKVKCAGR